MFANLLILLNKDKCCLNNLKRCVLYDPIVNVYIFDSEVGSTPCGFWFWEFKEGPEGGCNSSF